MPSHDVASVDFHPPGEKNSDDGDPDSTVFGADNAPSNFEPYNIELSELTPCRAAWNAAKDFALQGYAHILPDDYDRSQLDDSHELRRAFRDSLQIDTEPGNRWRAYSALELRDHTATLLPAMPYVQTRQYNADDGDKLRQFVSLDRLVLQSRTLRELIRFNLSVAKLTNQILFLADSLLIGVHMVSYRTVAAMIAHSSPLGLHRDQEEYVAVILSELSHNISGGENILANGPRDLVEKVNLTEEFEAILLSKKGMHQVVPMSSSNGRPAFRNVILITLSPFPQ
ncbi:hypothetical protein J2W22_003931 [Sphingomonas kyeonggiensis]|uniref:2OG-Fe dioxygenase family protein n=1 Tax=Sphingomonas kyeonggiensis TaxID=1268553 RepID=UPI002788EAF2|nr:2OG-Fe dioxygenase family protein [Sphingomonas kyeonggiensis]MDQ0251843.1 hypothetical protein [Sphingomonas kyeonggiensis]